MELRVGIWNVEWRAWSSAAGRSIADQMWGRAPEVVCITEGRTEFPSSLGGHWISAEGSYGYRDEGNRRKVMLWSQAPWANLQSVGVEAMPGGRFVSGKTETSIGEITFIGVCIPWREAHVRSGRKDREPWEEWSSPISVDR